MFLTLWRPLLETTKGIVGQPVIAKVALLLLLPSVSFGQTAWQSPEGGTWNLDANWSQGTPGRGDTALFGEGTLLDGGTIRVDGASELHSIRSEAQHVRIVGDTLTLFDIGEGPATVQVVDQSAELVLENRLAFSQSGIVDVAFGSNLETIEPIDAQGNLFKAGAGTWELGGGFTSNWAGTLVIREGRAVIPSFASLGTSEGGVLLDENTSLELKGGVYPLESFTLMDGSRLDLGGDLGVFLSGGMTTEGSIRLNAETPSLNVRLAGPTDGVGEIHLTGAGHFVLQSNSSHKGTLHVWTTADVTTANVFGSTSGSSSDATVIHEGGRIDFISATPIEVHERLVLAGGTIRERGDGELTIQGPIVVQSDSSVEVGNTSVRGDVGGEGSLLFRGGDVELAGNVHLPAGIEIDGVVRLAGAITIDDRTPISLLGRGTLFVDTPSVLTFARPLSGNLIASKDVRVSNNELVLVDSSVQFENGANLMAVSAVVQDGPGRSTLGAIGTASSTEIHIQEGFLTVTPGASRGHQAPTRFLNRRNAVLIIDGTLDGPIRLNNATGYLGNGAVFTSQNDGVIDGSVFLGEVGAILGGGGDLTIHGPISGGALEALDVTLTSADHAYSGATTVGGTNNYRGMKAGDLILHGNARLSATSSIKTTWSSSLILDRTSADQLDSIADDIPIALDGGSIVMVPNGIRGASERLGLVRLESGAGAVGFRSSAADAQIRITALERRPGTGLTIVHPQPASLGQTGDSSSRIFIESLQESGFLGGWATVANFERSNDELAFASYDVGLGVSVKRPEDLVSLGTATPQDHALIESNQTLSSNLQVNSITSRYRVEAFHLDLAGHQLNVTSGGILTNVTRDGAPSISGGELTGGEDANGELYFQTVGQLVVDAAIVDRGDVPVSVVKLQRGRLTLSGRNRHTGTTHVLDGELKFEGRDAVSPTSSIHLSGGQLSFSNVVGEALPIGALYLNAGTVEGECCVDSSDPAFEGIAPTEIWARGGALRVALAGDAPFIKETSGRVSIESDLPYFDGDIEIRSGVLEIGRRGASNHSYPAGRGKIRVHDSSYLVSWNETLPNDLTLDNAALLTNATRMEVTGIVKIQGDSEIATYYAYQDGRDNQLIDSRDLVFHNIVEVERESTISVPGTGSVRFDHLRLLGSAQIESDFAAITVRDIVINGRASTLDWNTGENSVPNFSLQLVNGAQLRLNEHGEVGVLNLNDEGQLLGDGTFEGDLVVASGAAVSPAAEVAGTLLVRGNIQFKDRSSLIINWGDQRSLVPDRLQVEGTVVIDDGMRIKLRGPLKPNASDFDPDRIQSTPVLVAQQIAIDQGVIDVDARHLLNAIDLPVTSIFSTRIDAGVLWVDFQPSFAGDANNDGRFDSSDLILVFRAGSYNRPVDDALAWSQGDWNGDGMFDSTDLVAAFRTGRYDATAVTVPEPDSSWLLYLVMAFVFARKT